MGEDNVVKIPGSDICYSGPGDMTAFLKKTLDTLVNGMMMMQLGMEQIASQTNEISTKKAIDDLLEKVRNS